MDLEGLIHPFSSVCVLFAICDASTHYVITKATPKSNVKPLPMYFPNFRELVAYFWAVKTSRYRKKLLLKSFLKTCTQAIVSFRNKYSAGYPQITLANGLVES